MQHYTLILVSFILVLSMTGCEDSENEPFIDSIGKISQSAPSFQAEPDGSPIQAAPIEPARTPLEGDVAITVNDIEIPEEISQSTLSIQAESDNSPIQTAPIEPARTPLEGDVTIAVNVTELPDRSVRIHGTTNLPTGTHLMLTVAERAQGGFHGQSKCDVAADGSFESEAFGPRDGLKDGVYIAEVLMPLPSVQPDNVKKLLGEKGERLSGPLVEEDWLGVTVSAKKEFTIGGAQAAQAQHERVENRIREYDEWVKKIVALHARLQAAIPSRQEEIPAGTFAFGGKWNKFGQEFVMEIQSHKQEALEIESFAARSVIYDPLECIRRMFHTTAFQKSQEFNEASADYMKSLKKLEEFIAEAKSTQ